MGVRKAGFDLYIGWEMNGDKTCTCTVDRKLTDDCLSLYFKTRKIEKLYIFSHFK